MQNFPVRTHAVLPDFNQDKVLPSSLLKAPLPSLGLAEERSNAAAVRLLELPRRDEGGALRVEGVFVRGELPVEDEVEVGTADS